jgi:hypothetical protein
VAAEGFEVTVHGLRKLGSGSTDATGNKTPGTGVGILTLLATHNPAGLIISTGMKAYDEETGRSGIEGRVKSTVTEIADVLKKRFQQEGWISQAAEIGRDFATANRSLENASPEVPNTQQGRDADDKGRVVYVDVCRRAGPDGLPVHGTGPGER